MTRSNIIHILILIVLNIVALTLIIVLSIKTPEQSSQQAVTEVEIEEKEDEVADSPSTTDVVFDETIEEITHRDEIMTDGEIQGDIEVKHIASSESPVDNEVARVTQEELKQPIDTSLVNPDYQFLLNGSNYPKQYEDAVPLLSYKITGKYDSFDKSNWCSGVLFDDGAQICDNVIVHETGDHYAIYKTPHGEFVAIQIQED